jgi:hypothetical protein
MTLRELIVAESSRETFPAAHFFAQHLATSFGHSVAAVLFYGSCLRQATDEGLLLDFYVLVDRMSDAIQNPISATVGAVLSPNVYYREVPYEGRTLRAKVAVMTMARFLRDTSPGCFASSIWARFSQTTLILYARTPVIRDRAEEGLIQAIETMAHNTAPLLAKTFTARELWVQALTCTYGAELRPESAGKAIELVEADMARYERITDALFGPGIDGAYPNTFIDLKDIALRDWRWRRIQGKVLNVLRLIKAAFTFQGGLDYAVWKIERHSGVKMELTDAERRHPLLTGLKLLPRLLKKGGLK